MRLYNKGYTIKQRFTGLLVVALVPVMLLGVALTAVITELGRLSYPTAYKLECFVDWYGRLLESMKKKGG